MQADSVYSTHTTTQLHKPTAFRLWETARSLGLPAALWRLPSQRDRQLIVSFDAVLPRVSADLDELPAGFLISPFDSFNQEAENESLKTLFLRADIQAAFSETGQVIGQLNDDAPTAQHSQFWNTLQAQSRRETHPSAAAAPTPIDDLDAQALYKQNVAQAVAAIQRGEMRKVVLSRTKQVLFNDAPNVIELFDALCERYPTAFISAVSLPERGQVWMSATPERLVSVAADGTFRTASLAGTQSAYHEDGTAKRSSQAMWSQKEIEEQALVSRYIIECFKKIRLREYLEEGPKTLIAGNLMHLATTFTVDTQAVRYPQLGTVMLRLLHPTSAVCGTPRDAAFAFIRQHEVHDREFYSGFLGPVNINDTDEGPSSHLFVHIRCMKLEGKTATLYAGAGLTEDSDPEREWLETDMKCQTLLKIILNA